IQGHDENECFIIHPELYPKKEETEKPQPKNDVSRQQQGVVRCKEEKTQMLTGIGERSSRHKKGDRGFGMGMEKDKEIM
ncbi:hypothetical protein HAX54_035652, partial [Datura stramonium]|nr:hypothetical protein [Datura stramonium]